MEACLATFCSTRKMIAEHRKAALGLFPRGFVLNDVPVFHENSILDAKNVCGDPIDGLAEAGESAMNDNEISICHNCARLIPERGRKTFDEVKESLAPRLDVSAVLDVVGRPISLGLGVISFIEERVEGLEH
jgi:hypothetical protein